MKQMYTLKSIKKLIEDCTGKHGYTIAQIRDGTLGYGKMVLLAPPGYWNFVIEEIYLNEWSSGHTVRKCREISKRLQTEIDAYSDLREMEVE